ncbi:peptidoglycan editing factor PgeF [Candidatus Riflebacteria bacterium]
MLLEAGLSKHAFFGRKGGFSRRNELNLACNSWDLKSNVEKNFDLVRGIFGIKKESLFVLNQVHGSEIFSYSPHTPVSVTITADAFLTRCKGKGAVIRTADCIPLIFFNRLLSTLILVHSGWRGVLAGIPEKALAIFTKKPSDCLVALGPSICANCFEVKKDVLEKFQNNYNAKHLQKIIISNDRGYYIDLKKSVAERLLNLGLPEKNIDISSHCTVCQHMDFFSYRVEGENRGSNGSLAIL